MECIEAIDVQAFDKYLCCTKNPICGRHPIAVLMNGCVAAETAFDISFVKYAQSGPVSGAQDSSREGNSDTGSSRD